MPPVKSAPKPTSSPAPKKEEPPKAKGVKIVPPPKGSSPPVAVKSSPGVPQKKSAIPPATAPSSAARPEVPSRPKAQQTKKFLIRNRDDEKSWVKIELKNPTIAELTETVAKRLRVNTSAVSEIHTATVLDESTGKADMKYCKVLRQDAEVSKQPNGTFLEIVLAAEFDMDSFVAQYQENEKKGLRELIKVSETMGLDSSKCESKSEVLNLIKDTSLQKLSFKQLMTVADRVEIDWSSCESKSDLILLLKGKK
jgi:hypothetical protein